MRVVGTIVAFAVARDWRFVAVTSLVLAVMLASIGAAWRAPPEPCDMLVPSVNPIGQIQREHGIVGRERELATALAVLGAGRHLLLEGPVGVGKTTVALAVCGHLGRDTVRVDGDDRYSESKLTGWFDPPLVLKQGYGEEAFFAGPLVEAMRDGKVLFINELNRMPESVQNVLLPALDERLLQLPHIGEVRAAEGFQVVATQNPVEYVATGHLSEALRDRFEHLGAALPGQPTRKRRSWSPRPARTTPRSCDGRARSRGRRGCTRAFARARPCAAPSPRWRSPSACGPTTATPAGR